MSRKGEFFTAPLVWSRSPHGAKRNAGVAVRYGEGRAWISLAPSGLWRGARSIERSSAVGSATAGDLGQHGGQIRASAVAHHQRHDGRIGPTYGSVKKREFSTVVTVKNSLRRKGERAAAPAAFCTRGAICAEALNAFPRCRLASSRAGGGEASDDEPLVADGAERGSRCDRVVVDLLDLERAVVVPQQQVVSAVAAEVVGAGDVHICG